MNEELLQTLSQMGEAALGPMGRVVIELSNVGEQRKAYCKMLDRAQRPDPTSPTARAAHGHDSRWPEKAADVENKQVDSDLKRIQGVKTMIEAQAVPAEVASKFQNVSRETGSSSETAFRSHSCQRLIKPYLFIGSTLPGATPTGITVSNHTGTDTASRRLAASTESESVIA